MKSSQFIFAEVERRWKDNTKAAEKFAPKSQAHANFMAAAKEDFDILAFMDTLPNCATCKNAKSCQECKNGSLYEEGRNEKKLGKEIEKYFASWDKNTYGVLFTGTGAAVNIERVKLVARHFAIWGAEHLSK